MKSNKKLLPIKPFRLHVTLRSVGNPDFGQDPDRPLYGVPTRKQAVGSLAEASALCKSYIHTFDLGGGNWAGGKVYLPNGHQVAEVSYNGRIWEPRPTGEWKLMPEFPPLKALYLERTGELYLLGKLMLTQQRINVPLADLKGQNVSLNVLLTETGRTSNAPVTDSPTALCSFQFIDKEGILTLDVRQNPDSEPIYSCPVTLINA